MQLGKWWNTEAYIMIVVLSNLCDADFVIETPDSMLVERKYYEARAHATKRHKSMIRFNWLFQ